MTTANRGANQPQFRELQLEFAQHIRNPELYPIPDGIEPRRMQIYVDLFYKSIEAFLSNTFPVCREILGEDAWHRLARDFIHRHVSTSPYFLDIPQEYLEYLGEITDPPVEIPDYLLELAHYEWVELALDVADEDFPEAIDPDGDMPSGYPVVSPLAWSLAYRYAVHRIRPDNRPSAPEDAPVCLIVYRNRDDEVGFMESNPVTAALLEALQANVADATTTGREAVTTVLVQTLGEARDEPIEQGLATLERLRQLDIIAGVRS